MQNIGYTGNNYGGVAPQIAIGADFYFPRLSLGLLAQLMLSFTPSSLKATKEAFEGDSPKLKSTSLTLQAGVAYQFNSEASVRPYVGGGIAASYMMKVKETDVMHMNTAIAGKTSLIKDNLDYGNTAALGGYVRAGVYAGRHFRFDLTYSLQAVTNKSLNSTQNISLTAAYVL